jgi:Flp pilus assembly protein TadD
MLKLGLHEAALNDATCATDCDATYCKSWWRRAIALKALGRTVEARVDALQALQLAGDNSAQVKNDSMPSR